MKRAKDRLFFKDKLTGEGEEQFYIILHMLECDGELIDFNNKISLAKNKMRKKELKRKQKAIDTANREAKLLIKLYQKCIRELNSETKKMIEGLKIKI